MTTDTPGETPVEDPLVEPALPPEIATTGASPAEIESAEGVPAAAPLPPDLAPVSGEQVSGDQQTWRLLAHASALIQFIGIPSFVGPLVVWFMRRDDPVVAPHAREALNFQLSLIIYFVLGVIVAVLAAITVVGVILSVLILAFLAVLLVAEIVFAILATVAASRGELYRYPLSINLIKG